MDFYKVKKYFTTGLQTTVERVKKHKGIQVVFDYVI
jgi:hypothetical protein